MAAYRVFLIGRDKYLKRVLTLHCPDDAEALEGAAQLSDHYDADVWQQERHVGTLKRRS